MEYCRITLGFGNNTDYELEWNQVIIENEIRKLNIHNCDLQKINILKDERDLIISLLYFMSKGIGGECTTNDYKILHMFSQKFKYKVTIGGTCPRAAIAMNTIGYKSYMHLVVMNNYIKKIFPPGCKYICSNKEESFDIHLIFQYPKYATIKANDICIQTKRENRIIIGNNDTNSIMNIDRKFLTDIVPNSKVLLISGFNTMVNIDLLYKRLSLIKEELTNIKNKGVKIFFEDAHYVSNEANQLAKELLFDYVDIFSFNEDEFQSYCNKKINLLNTKEVLQSLEELYKTFNIPTIVVHSKYWAIAYGKGSSKYKNCLKGGVTMATTRFRFGDNFNSPHQYKETYNLPEEKEGKKFAEEFNKLITTDGYCIPSVVVKENNVTTVGLGDAFVGGFIPQLSKME